MPQITVSITNAITGRKHAPLSIYLEDAIIEQVHTLMSKDVHPDCNINFYWGKNFILGMPYNMGLDEILLNEGKMTWEAYMAKWYPEVAGPEYSN
jgi:hypothetical protein